MEGRNTEIPAISYPAYSFPQYVVKGNAWKQEYILCPRYWCLLVWGLVWWLILLFVLNLTFSCGVLYLVTTVVVYSLDVAFSVINCVQVDFSARSGGWYPYVFWTSYRFNFTIILRSNNTPVCIEDSSYFCVRVFRKFVDFTTALGAVGRIIWLTSWVWKWGFVWRKVWGLIRGICICGHWECACGNPIWNKTHHSHQLSFCFCTWNLSHSHIFLALQFTRPIWGANVPLLVFLLLFDTYINANSFFRVRWCVYILGYNCYRSG